MIPNPGQTKTTTETTSQSFTGDQTLKQPPYKQEEIHLYEQLLSSWGQNGTFPAQSAQYLQSTGLPKEILKEIWSRSAHGKTYLTKDEFFLAMRLIVIVQQGKLLNEQSLINFVPQPPVFNQPTQAQHNTPTKTQDPTKITQQELQEYNNEILKVSLGMPFVSEKKVVDYLTKGKGVPEAVVSEILSICNPYHSIRISKDGFVVILHLVSLKRRGIQLPPSHQYLPPSFTSLLGELLIDPFIEKENEENRSLVSQASQISITQSPNYNMNTITESSALISIITDITATSTISGSTTQIIGYQCR
ncbi:MAG: hypothetical protein EZS28_030146 [Streblomastix strix]|uniref:EH domain-containing protein n=1 Tax=Streblomastix strix TaxID=222440 RepID=A0A5J4UV63_9EUKA|nr:MAG: hypothetical protein EZS28_030146 [Streblomastix strix]